jgi:hypothetical protein
MSWQHAWHNVSEAIPKQGQSCKLSTTLAKEAALKGLAQYTYKTITREALPLIPSRPLSTTLAKKAALKGLAPYTYKTITREALPLISSRPLTCNIWIVTQTRQAFS